VGGCRYPPASLDEEDSVSGFVQIIEWKTSRIDEIEKLNEEWRERFPKMGPTRVLVCADRDNAGSYMTIVEFSSYEEAMENSKDPATSEFADRMSALTDGTPVFHNLDIRRDENRS
jgi:hypothetical protein